MGIRAAIIQNDEIVNIIEVSEIGSKPFGKMYKDCEWLYGKDCDGLAPGMKRVNGSFETPIREVSEQQLRQQALEAARIASEEKLLQDAKALGDNAPEAVKEYFAAIERK